MAFVVVLALLIVPAVLVLALQDTRVFWSPGVGLLVIAGIALLSWPTTRGDPGGVGAFSVSVLSIAAVALIAYGVICLVIGVRLHARGRKPSPGVELPPARVVDAGSKR